MYTIINWIINQRVSLLLYLGALISLGLYSIFERGFFAFSMILFSIGFIYDSVLIFKKSHSTYWEKFIYLGFSIMAYFSYIISESIAQNSIYDVVKVNPELFGLSLNYFHGLYFLPAIALLSGLVLAFGFGLFLIIFLIPMFLEILGFNKDKLQFIQKEFVHTFFYLLSAIILIFTFLNDSDNFYDSFFGKNYVAKKLLDYSYFPNKTCTNIKSGSYIKFLDSGLVSVSNIDESMKNKISDETEITFEVKKCKQIISM